MIIVKSEAMMDTYAMKDLANAIKEMADTGVIVLGKGLNIINTDDQIILDALSEAEKNIKILETPEGNTPPGF